MRRPSCGSDNPDGGKFCIDCGTAFRPRCPRCGTDNLPRAKFCGECGTALSEQTPAPPPSHPQPPVSYTPQYLVEKILTSRSALEGERKQVTVLFADLKGSMELLADRDPEEARQLPDPILERMMAAVHRYEGTVNQVMANFYVGAVYDSLGDYRRAVDCLGWNVVSLEGDRLRERFAMTGLPSVLSRVYLSWSLAELGAFAEAVARGEEGVRQERGSEALALRLLGEMVAHRDPPEVEQAESYYHEARALADELGMRPLQAHCHLGLGTLYAKIGRYEQARAELSAAIALYRAMDMTFWLPQAEAVLAHVEGR
jgi:class 3 adenylate cyclase